MINIEDVKNTIIYGLALETLKKFPDKCINSVITSPPYWQLRDYNFPDQWGLEPTFQEYLEHLWTLMDEIYRILKDDGTVWINLGDTYNSPMGINIKKNNNYPIKSQCIIPHRFYIGCADGINGHKQWVCRNDIIWAKRNCMPESCADRFSKKCEFFFFMTKQGQYYFDLHNIKDKYAESTMNRKKSGIRDGGKTDKSGFKPESQRKAFIKMKSGILGGKNPGNISDFWDISVKFSHEKHFATFNTKLVSKPIIAGCPEGGIILDPFAGTSTTLIRAYELGRQFIGIDGNSEYVEFSNKRLKNQNLRLELRFL